MTMPRTSTRACTSPLGQKWRWSHFEGPRQHDQPNISLVQLACRRKDTMGCRAGGMGTANCQLVSDPIPLDLGFMSMCHVPFEIGFLGAANNHVE